MRRGTSLGATVGPCSCAFVDSANDLDSVPSRERVPAKEERNAATSCDSRRRRTIAVNPLNPLNLVAGANDYRVCCDFTGLNDATGWAYYSMDGGVTWGNVQLPGLTVETGGSGNFKRVDSAGDPVVTFGPDGTVYYANILFSRVSAAWGVVVSRSTDGGRTWSEGSVAAYSDAGNFLHDKEWIGAGPDGKVVVAWTRFNLGPHGAGYRESPIVGAFSKDGGRTWNRQSFPIFDAAHPFDQGSQVQYGPDGALRLVRGRLAEDGLQDRRGRTSPVDRRREVVRDEGARLRLRRPRLLSGLRRLADAHRHALPAQQPSSR